MFQKLSCAQAGFHDALKRRRGYAAKHLRRLHASRKTRGWKGEQGEERRRRSKRRSKWKKRARLNGVGGGVARACLLCERLKVSLIFPTITPPVFLLVARLLFAKLKGPTPSRSRHHPRGSCPPPSRAGWMVRASFHILPIKMQPTEKPRERYCVIVGDVL